MDSLVQNDRRKHYVLSQSRSQLITGKLPDKEEMSTHGKLPEAGTAGQNHESTNMGVDQVIL